MSDTAKAAQRAVKAWKAVHGHGGERLGWSTREAAGLAQLKPAHLTDLAKRGLVLPTVNTPAIPSPLYCSADIICAQAIVDLEADKLRARVLSRVADELAQWRRHAVDIRKVARQGWTLAVAISPADDEPAAVFDTDERRDDDTHVCFAFSDAAEELDARVDEWWSGKAPDGQRRPPWL